MPRYVATDQGLGRLADGDRVELLDLPGATLDDAFRSGVTDADLRGAAVRSTAALATVRLRAPVLRPARLWAVGYAYADHKREVGRDTVDENPHVFLKAAGSISGPGDPIPLPAIAPDHVDFEGEIAVVIGRPGANVAEDAAWDHVLGLTAGNDVSARDIQKQGRYNGGQSDASKAKSFDGFTPLGPCVCTPDEYADPDDVELSTTVDGVRRQHARSSQLIFSIPRIVAFVSRFGALTPGDVILTGTPAGVGHPEGRFLAHGSTVKVDVEGVGTLSNEVIAA